MGHWELVMSKNTSHASSPSPPDINLKKEGNKFLPPLGSLIFINFCTLHRHWVYRHETRLLIELRHQWCREPCTLPDQRGSLLHNLLTLCSLGV